MVMDVNWTYYGDHFAIYTNIKSMHCTPKMICQLYLNTINNIPFNKLYFYRFHGYNFFLKKRK